MPLRHLSLVLFSAAATSAQAHVGHGAAEFHWHASDTWGFLMVAALAVAAIWFSRGE